MNKIYHPAFLRQRVDYQVSTQYWGVMVMLGDLTGSLTKEAFDTYPEAEAKAAELNKFEKEERIRNLL
ncbi:hypothetical protein ACFOEI_00745 [Modicisalibacter luteus]|uniref:Uncharacterized protein n=1 Tax=Modicisalibacter luteus TaxID=453962 RepID=A0ABV7LVK4_9GAMM|nr:hypothetical protein GCM10007159_40290 [Halomonas lutea]